MPVLKNAQINWVKMEQDKPDMGYDGDSPSWQITATVDKKFFAAWRKKKLGGAKEHDDGTYSVVIKRKANVYSDGGAKDAPKCLNGNLQPIESETVGNGSIANVQYSIYDWEFKNKKGKAADLTAIQVTTLVVREGTALEFEVEGDDVDELDSEADEAEDDENFETDADEADEEEDKEVY